MCVCVLFPCCFPSILPPQGKLAPFSHLAHPKLVPVASKQSWPGPISSAVGWFMQSPASASFFSPLGLPRACKEGGWRRRRSSPPTRPTNDTESRPPQHLTLSDIDDLCSALFFAGGCVDGAFLLTACASSLHLAPKHPFSS